MSGLTPAMTDAYPRRIGYFGSRAPTAETLAALCQAHLRTVPFENLDILANIPLDLSTEGRFHQIVERRRGGFCFQLNGLFAELLIALGFHVRRLSTRFVQNDGSLSTEFDHLSLLVDDQDDQTWFVDVGAARYSLPIPLAFTEGVWSPPQPHDGARLRMVPHQQSDHPGPAQTGQIERWEADGDSWRPYYEIDLQPRELAEFAPRCHVFETASDSHFRQGPMICQLTSNGWITVRDGVFVTVNNGERQERPVEGEPDLVSILTKRFGLPREQIPARLPIAPVPVGSA